MTAASNTHPELKSALAAWFDDNDAAALEKAGRLAREQPVDIDWLLNWARDYGGSAQATSLALRRLRFALGLPVVAGPVCRRPTGD
ncbi:hypothetical protein [uncultured Nevskia sp.]|uniref:hypothetical protein n=1 Tax=uncultured Nevskia sp. TaxID=228950 RepID=UPI0025DB2029|nr:hypothetical protein [uncultured Nevskia sp.]